MTGLGVGVSPYLLTTSEGANVPANVMRYQDGTPMRNQDGSYMTYQQ